MVWTTTTPKELGYYWIWHFNCNSKPYIIELVAKKDIIYDPISGLLASDFISVCWEGPIKHSSMNFNNWN
jgi:hypothetical protein